MATIHVDSPNVQYTESHIAVDYEYTTTSVDNTGDIIIVSMICLNHYY